MNIYNSKLLLEPIWKQEIARPTGKDIVEDYQSEDGNYKYHAEIHYATGSL